MAGAVQTEAEEMKVLDSPVPSNVWQTLFSSYEQPTPEGFESKKQISEKIGRGPTQTKEFIYKMVKAGKLEVFTSARNGTKYYRPTNYEEAKRGQKHRRHR
jgi:hypothetical protein